MLKLVVHKVNVLLVGACARARMCVCVGVQEQFPIRLKYDAVNASTWDEDHIPSYNLPPLHSVD